MLNETIESFIASNTLYNELPHDVQTVLGNSQREYDKRVVEYSVRNQLKHKGNIVRFLKKAEEYYELILKYSSSKLMLYPYHLSDELVGGLRVTPFEYYHKLVETIMKEERSYDSLPNFTAADVVRLLGIGRNQYIDLMNQSRSYRKLFRRRTIQDILPQRPVEFAVEPWYMLHSGCILDADIRQLELEEKEIVDRLIDGFPLLCGLLNKQRVKTLYGRGLVYISVPISEDDFVFVPTLDNFVMNRCQNDYLESTLYKLFVSIDGQMSVKELADVIGVPHELAKNGISLLCRLGFAKKRVTGIESITLERSWQATPTSKSSSIGGASSLLEESMLTSTLAELSSSLTAADDDEYALEASTTLDDSTQSGQTTTPNSSLNTPALDASQKRVSFIFDFSLTAFLMMGNLSSVGATAAAAARVSTTRAQMFDFQSLKQHAVTLFEVGKLSDDSVESFVDELAQVRFFAEGDAQTYSEHARTLLQTIKTIRAVSEIDLIRGESLLSLDHSARMRMLQKSYKLSISMAPIATEACAFSAAIVPHIGSLVVELASPWFRLFLYNLVGAGPASVYLPMGTCLLKMPDVLHTRRLITASGNHEPILMNADQALLQIGENLLTSSVFVQEYSDVVEDAESLNIPFPFVDTPVELQNERHFCNHPTLKAVREKLNLDSLCGYATFIRMRKPKKREEATENAQLTGDAAEQADTRTVGGEEAGTNLIHASFCNTTKDPRKIKSTKAELSANESFEDWILFDVLFGIPLFDEKLNASVCERLIAADILAAANIDRALFATKNIVDTVRAFVQQNRDVENEAPFDKVETNEVPAPTRTITFPTKNTSAIKSQLV